MVKYGPQELDNMFHAFADPTRREIVRNLSQKPQPITQVAKPFPISLPAITKHIKVLEKADLITRQKKGRENVLTLNPDSIKEMNRYLSFYQDFWNDKFESLQSYLDKKQKNLKGDLPSKTQTEKEVKEIE